MSDVHPTWKIELKGTTKARFLRRETDCQLNCIATLHLVINIKHIILRNILNQVRAELL